MCPIVSGSLPEDIRVFDDQPNQGKHVPGVCYTAFMFIHRISITGCSDRGAWPWRTTSVLPERTLLPRA